MRTSHTSAYQEMMINSKLLEVPRGTYQRELRVNRVRKIVAKFDPRLVNPPKVSYRNGHCSTASTPSQSSSCSMAVRT